MSPQAVSNRIRNDRQKAAVRLQPAFPAAVEEDSDPIDELLHLKRAHTSLSDPRSHQHAWYFTKQAVGRIRLSPFSGSPLDSRPTSATHTVLPASAMAACSTMFGQPC